MDYARTLYDSLDARWRPEDVADAALCWIGDSLGERAKAALDNAGAYSHRRSGRWTSMSEDFARPASPDHQVKVVADLFGVPTPDTTGLDELRWWACEVGVGVNWGLEHRNFLADRLNAEQREMFAVDVPKRQYNRRWRALVRLADKLDRIDAQAALRRLTLVGRSGLAHKITFARFQADPRAACLVAYLVARRNLRRQFSLSGRHNPRDHLVMTLLAECDAHAQDTDWAMIALVQAWPRVLAQMGQQAKGELVGQWSAVMHEAATRLGTLAATQPNLNLERMVVRPGQDSSTWNLLASAYNTARDSWLASLSAVGASALLDTYCPPKAMRLMAADLVAWHEVSGGGVDPQTLVWAALPRPWDVISGATRCDRAMVTLACRTFGVDPEHGWVDPRPLDYDPADFQPTPELVHGVSVADPSWAGLLRRAGVFSGYHANPDAATLRQLAFTGGLITSDLPKAPALGVIDYLD